MTDCSSPPAPAAAPPAGSPSTIEGSGQPIVLVHAGVADRRMWDPSWPAFAARHRVIRLRRPRLRRDPAAGRAVVASRRPARPARRAADRPGAPRRDVDGGRDRGRGGARPARRGRVARARGARRRALRRGAGRRCARSGPRRSTRSTGATSMARSRSTSGPGSTARARPPDAVDPEVRAFVGTDAARGVRAARVGRRGRHPSTSSAAGRGRPARRDPLPDPRRRRGRSTSRRRSTTADRIAAEVAGVRRSWSGRTSPTC